jgi:hypothetical protein
MTTELVENPWTLFGLRSCARVHRAELSGDGHTATSIKQMKRSEDEKFFYHFTFIETDREKGFVTHYRPRRPPLRVPVLLGGSRSRRQTMP